MCFTNFNFFRNIITFIVTQMNHGNIFLRMHSLLVDGILIIDLVTRFQAMTSLVYVSSVRHGISCSALMTRSLVARSRRCATDLTTATAL